MFSAEDMHMFAVTINGFLQLINPLLSAALGAYVMHIGHSSGPPAPPK